MRSITTLFLLLLGAASLSAQPSWKPLPAAPVSHRFDDMFFLNPQKGWAINPYFSYLTPRQNARIFTTNDGGRSWVAIVDSSRTFYRAIGFADAMHGWVGNYGGSLTPDTNFMYQTSDGGVSWQPVTAVTGPKPKGICGISVVNDSVIYAYGKHTGPAIIMKTTNRGLTWTSTDLSSMASGLVDGYFINADTGFISGEYDAPHKALILSTFDGGATWQVRHQSPRKGEVAWKLSFPSRMTGYASIQSGLGGGGFPPDTTWFLKTIDGGLSWQERVFRTSRYYSEQGIGFLNDSVGWIGGDHSDFANYKTTDGGATWAPDTSFGLATPPFNYAYSVNRFRKFGDTLMYASGNTLYRFGNPLPPLQIPQIASPSIDVFPNPVSDYVDVRYIPGGATGQAVLSLYNILGQLLLKDVPVRAGANRFSIPNASKGQYIYSIRIGNKILASGLLTGL